MVFALGGGFVGLFMGWVLRKIDALGDPGGGIFIALVMLLLAPIAWGFGFNFTLTRLQKRRNPK